MPLAVRKKLSRIVTLALMSAPVAAVATVAAMAYDNLPGVRQPAIADQRGTSECEQVLVRNSFPFEPTNGPRYSYVYSCRQGDVSIRSNQLPPSLERQKRGLNY